MQKRSTEEPVPATGRANQDPYQMSVSEAYGFYDELRACPVTDHAQVA